MIDNIKRSILDINKTVIFVGAGLSVKAGIQNWEQSMNSVVEEYHKVKSDHASCEYFKSLISAGRYTLMMENVFELTGTPIYLNILEKIYDKKSEITEDHLNLVKIPCAGYITTNFDKLIEIAFIKSFGTPLFTQNYKIESIQRLLASEKKFLLKLHGDIDNIDELVIRKSQYDSLKKDTALKDLFRKYMTQYQFIFIGYSLRDADFSSIWDVISGESRLKYPALLFSQKGNYSSDERSKLHEKNIILFEPVEVDPAFEFISKIIKALSEDYKAISKQAQINKEIDEEKYNYDLMVIELFDSKQQDLYKSFIKTIILNFLFGKSNCVIEKTSITNQIEKVLSLDIDDYQLQIILKELETSGILQKQKNENYLVAKKINNIKASLDNNNIALDVTFHNLLDRVAKIRKVEIKQEDYEILKELVITLFEKLGKSLAEKVLFYKNLSPIEKEINEIINSFLRQKNRLNKEEFFICAIFELLANSTEDEGNIVYKLIQASFITNAFVLNPGSEKLLKKYVSQFITYFDSNLVLQAMAIGHPSNKISIQLIEKTKSLGIKVRILKEIFDEVLNHANIAIKKYAEISKTGINELDAIEGYIMLTGKWKCNVFLLGYYEKLKMGEQINWNNYMLPYCEKLNRIPKISKNKCSDYVTSDLGLEIYSYDYKIEHQSEIKVLKEKTINLRKFGHRYINDLLCENEARQFFVIYQQRLGEMTDKVWFITNDFFIIQLYEEFREKYALPSSYTPIRWFQYLNFVDHDIRSNRHFKRLFKYAEVGALEDELAIDTIKLIAKKHSDLKTKDPISVSKFAHELINKYHIKNVYSEIVKSVSHKGENNYKQVVKKEIEGMLDQFVTLQVSEVKEHEKTKVQLAKTEKQLKQEKYKRKQLRNQFNKGHKKRD